ncbi:MAG TPA: hypothetical protein VG222_08220 [Vicinamibacterales bacterium]|jgi:hypothetical protein|nr:hypothetical protein [Vicinamibacterales bacterium]
MAKVAIIDHAVGKLNLVREFIFDDGLRVAGRRRRIPVDGLVRFDSASLIEIRGEAWFDSTTLGGGL